MERLMVVVPEKKEVIEKIKKKYNKLQMSDKTAGKIQTLEITNKILTAATLAAGFATVVDLIIPDPVIGLDEAALAALTGLLKYSSSLVDNKINQLVESDDAELKMKEVEGLTEQMKKAAKAVSASRKQVAK